MAVRSHRCDGWTRCSNTESDDDCTRRATTRRVSALVWYLCDDCARNFDNYEPSEAQLERSLEPSGPTLMERQVAAKALK